MPLEWNEAMSVGVDEIDDQHRELFRRAGGVLEGLKRGEPEEISGLVEYLYDYAVSHFGAEEAFMRETRYRGYLRHKAEHDRFTSDLLELSREIDRKGHSAFLALRVNQWLVRWLEEHVSGTDAELGRHLARRTA